MRKGYGLTIFVTISLSLALIIVGCNAPDSGYYIIHNGTRTPCNGFSSNCGDDFYEVETPSGITYHCTSAYGDTCDVFHPITPPATSPQCVPKYVYDNLINEGQSWVVVSQQQDQNNSPSPAQATFTSMTSKTVTVTDKLDVIANLNVTVAGDAGSLIGIITLNVKAEIDHEVTQTVNAAIGNAYDFSVPPGETAYANYGVKVQITGGHLYDKAGCKGKKSDWGTDVTYVPIASGWCVWLSNQSACPSL